MAAAEPAAHGATPVVVMDNGSCLFRAGYPSESAPRVLIPSLVGLPRNKGVAMAAGYREYEVGYGALEQQGNLDTSQPVRAGVVTNWHDMERLWSHVIYKELRIAPENFCFVISESTKNSEKDKERTLEMLMETFNAHSMYLGSTAVLALYSYGSTTGVVLDSGLDRTNVVPVHEGYPLSRHMTTSKIAGDALTSHLCSLLNAKGYGFSTRTEQALVNQVKESLCFVRDAAAGPGEEAAMAGAAADEGFQLPDGQHIPMEDERFACTEVLFNHGLLGAQHVPKTKVFDETGAEYQPTINKGVSWMVYASINNCEQSLRRDLFNNVVLAGGSTLFPGMRLRIQQEVTQLYKDMHPGEGLIPISIHEMACRQHATWLGGCMLSQIAMFPHLTVTRDEYHEHGASIVHCKSL